MIKTRRTQIVGVLNVTPDSFSDGGLYLDSDRAVEHGLRLMEQGADVIDVGAESTSFYTDPQKRPIDAKEQIKRAIPVIAALARHGIADISIDTTNAEVAKAALENGATWINDQSAGLSDPLMPLVMSKAKRIVLMHGFGLGFGVDEGEKDLYSSVVDELVAFFEKRFAVLASHGVTKEKILIDPGFGFGKGLEHSLELLAHLDQFSCLGVPVQVGMSRKSFIVKLTNIALPHERDNASLAANVMAMMAGVEFIRTHNVKMLAEARWVADAALSRRDPRFVMANLPSEGTN